MNIEKVIKGDNMCGIERKIEVKCVIGLKWVWLEYGNEFCDSYVVENKCLKIESENELLVKELNY